MKRLVPVLFVLGIVATGCGSNPPASLAFVEVTPAQPRIGEIATIRFKAVDSRGLPMAGAAVSFRLQNEAPGVTINPALGTTLKGSGVVEATLVASARVSSVVVVAEAEGKTAISPPITFAGAQPSARQFTFGCGEFGGAAAGGIHGLIAYDTSRSLVPGIVQTCTAHVGDRNGDGVPGAQVSFLTEAGTIGPTETSKTDVIGNAGILYKTSLPLPKEVPPVTFTWNPAISATQTGDYFAPLWMHPYDWITNPILGTGTPGAEPRRNDPVYELLSGSTRVNNPRDNLVSMIAVTTGEEAFDDVNNNGVYNTGEPFTDLTEPFVDSNDNGTWDVDEKFIDTNVNGAWNGKNGVYDTSSLIWVTEKLLWTGVPNVPHDYQGAAPVVRLIQPVTQPLAVTHFGEVDFFWIYSDPWFNPIARNSDGDGCSAQGSDKVILKTSSTDKGILNTYPSATNINGNIQDAHDPTPIVGFGPVPPFNPAAEFDVEIVCTHTMSQKSQGKYFIRLGTFSGTVL